MCDIASAERCGAACATIIQPGVRLRPCQECGLQPRSRSALLRHIHTRTRTHTHGLCQQLSTTNLTQPRAILSLGLIALVTLSLYTVRLLRPLSLLSTCWAVTDPVCDGMKYAYIREQW